MVRTGFNDVIGSWKTMPMSPPANFTHLRVRQLHEIAAGEDNLAARDPPRRIRDQAQNRQRADGLARSALADDRHCLALLDGIRHPVDGAHDSRTGPELGVQILDI